MPSSLFESDVYKDFDHGGQAMSNKIKAILGKRDAAVIINDKMPTTLDLFRRTLKEPIVVQTLQAIHDGSLVLFIAAPEYNLPACLPFFKYKNKADGKVRVGVNLTNVAREVRQENALGDKMDAVSEYVIDDVNIVYTMLVSAYINLVVPDTSQFGPKVLQYGSLFWARMFNKILNKTIGLATSKDRYEAYLYFAVRFFLSYYMGAPDNIIESISLAVLKGKEKSNLILYIEDRIKENGINVNQDFTTFCQTMFNNDISNIKGIRITSANPNEQINVSFYIRKFIDSYHQSTLMTLGSFYYFIWVIMCVQMRAHLCNIKMFDDICSRAEMGSFMNGVYQTVAAIRK